MPPLLTSQFFALTTTVAGNLDFLSVPDANPNSPYAANVGNILDNVSVSTTPLPSTWSMLLAGFIGFGFVAYRGTRRNSSAVATV